MSKSINHKFFYPHSAEVVWEYLTKSELMELWLMKNDFQPIVGYDFQFKTNPIPNFNFDGIIYCKVLEIVSLKKLVYSWKGGSGNGEMTMDSIVEWTLTEKDNGTELKLIHHGFKAFDTLPIFAAMDAGWKKNIQKIYELINTANHGTINA